MPREVSLCPEAGCALPIGGCLEDLMASNYRAADAVSSFNLVDTLRLDWAPASFYRCENYNSAPLYS